MDKWLLLAAVDDRRHLLEPCLASIQKYLPDWKLVFVLQTPQEAPLEFPHGTRLLSYDHRLGMHNAKLVGLEWLYNNVSAPYVVCNIDDDMEFTPETDFDTVLPEVVKPHVGLVSCGWADNETTYEKRKASITLQFVQQPIVYTGGGMIFDHVTAEVIRAIGPGNLLCDNSEWSLAVYLSGRTNYRYRGSLCLHRIRRAGGRKGWVDLEERQRPDPKYLPFRPGKTSAVNHWLIGNSDDLTPLAHEVHYEARKSL